MDDSPFRVVMREEKEDEMVERRRDDLVRIGVCLYDNKESRI